MNPIESVNGSSIQGFVGSSDGTRIGFTRVGSGPSLVFVHGSLSTREDWLPVARLLADRFACYVMDRRGRGVSGDSSAYAIEREYEDIAAVVSAAGRRPSLLGHSFGAICALEAALRTSVPHLILYEPPLPVGGPVAGAGLAEYRAAVATNHLDEALEIGLTRFVGLSARQVAELRDTPIWSRFRSLAPTWTREIEASDGLSSDVHRYGTLTSRVLLVTGSESAEHPLKDATAALSQILPHVQLSKLAGQGHTAHRLAPQLVAETVAAFLGQ
jgi:pimeloyl-ACP methyl ester carboxylesterase